MILGFIPPFHDIAALREPRELWKRAEPPPFVATCRQMRHDGRIVWIDCLRAASKSLCEKRELAKLYLATFGPDADNAESRGARYEMMVLTSLALRALRALDEVLVGKRISGRVEDTV